jgi:hypothetical protein
MRLFRKFKNEVLPQVKAGWTSKVAGRLDQLQLRMAVYLNGKTANLSARGKWVFLVTVCVLFGGGSLYLLIHAFL